MSTKVSERNLYLYPNLEEMERSKRVGIRERDRRAMEEEVRELVKLVESLGERMRSRHR